MRPLLQINFCQDIYLSTSNQISETSKAASMETEVALQINSKLLRSFMMSGMFKQRCRLSILWPSFRKSCLKSTASTIGNKITRKNNFKMRKKRKSMENMCKKSFRRPRNKAKTHRIYLHKCSSRHKTKRVVNKQRQS